MSLPLMTLIVAVRRNTVPLDGDYDVVQTYIPNRVTQDEAVAAIAWEMAHGDISDEEVRADWHVFMQVVVYIPSDNPDYEVR